MPTVLRLGSLRVVIYPNDHEPPHVHLVGPDCHARIRLGTDKRKPSILSNDGVPARLLGRALMAIDLENTLLRKAWRQRNG